MALRFILAAFVVAVATAPASAQVRAGGEFRVNTATTGMQTSPAIAAEAGGDFMVVWTSRLTPGSLTLPTGQRFDAAGNPRGGEFVVAPQEAGLVDIATNRKGNSIVVWPAWTPNGSPLGVFGQRYDPAGAPVGGEFRIDTFNSPVSATWRARAAMAPDNSFVVVWDAGPDRDGGPGSGYGVFMRRYDAAGSPLGGELLVNSSTPFHQQGPDVAMDGEGRFVVVWADQAHDGSGYGVFGQRFDADGSRTGGEFLVNTYTTGHQSPITSHPVVERAPGGAFLVLWDDFGRDGNSLGVYGQRFDADGQLAGADFRVTGHTQGPQFFSAAAMDDIGNFVVTWTDDYDGNLLSVHGKRYTAAGAVRHNQFLVNTYTTGAQSQPKVVSDDVGNFVMTWQSYHQDGDAMGLYAQRFGGLRPTALEVDPAGNRVFEPGETVVVQPSWRNDNGAALTFGGQLSNLSGPAGPTYSIPDGAADYGTVASGAAAPCAGCYSAAASDPAVRPAPHWDLSADETLTPVVSHGQMKRWVLHVGESFQDVPVASPFYRFVETLFHRGVTGGCASSAFCPSQPTTREQMAVFLLVAREGAGYLPAACGTPRFLDVPATSPYCRWIEELARRGVVAGCSGGSFYCPTAPVTREQMAVFVLTTLDSTAVPPACGPPMFADVPATSDFCRWIEELARRGVVSGCGGGNYCPQLAVSREQMGVFLGVAFGMTLYGP